jgi:hypothetical protein
MAIKKNTSTNHAPASTDDTYAKLKALFQWKDNLESDLSTVACREIASGDEMFLNNIINALEESPMGSAMISDYRRSSNPNFDLLVFGARMYLAGKCSQQRYDDAAPQYAAVPMPHDPRPLQTAVAAYPRLFVGRACGAFSVAI